MTARTGSAHDHMSVIFKDFGPAPLYDVNQVYLRLPCILRGISNNTYIFGVTFV